MSDDFDARLPARRRKLRGMSTIALTVAFAMCALLTLGIAPSAAAAIALGTSLSAMILSAA